jgi:hypothetical protein
MKTSKILAALILIVLASLTSAKAESSPQNTPFLAMAQQIVNAEIVRAKLQEIDQKSIGPVELLTTRKKLVFFLEMDPTRAAIQIDLSGGKPRVYRC